MAYKKITAMDIWEILRRYKAGHSISAIKRALGYDRKTLRKFINIANENPYVFESKENAVQFFDKYIAEHTGCPSSKQEKLKKYHNELIGLITDKNHPLKAKHAFEVLIDRYPELTDVSYTSYKRYCRSIHYELYPDKTTCRIETEPGGQIQVDYAKVGILYDPLLEKNRTVYAFIGTLSHSRHKYVEFTFKQTQQSFVESHVRMFQFFGGVAHTIIIDNLKAGVIRPDLYDPKLNRAYREMAEHYGCFIDPARVSTPKDKPKVERDVQTIRDQFKKMIVSNNSLTLNIANNNILNWLVNTYGTRKHGTTKLEPMRVFKDIEQPALLPLPADRFQPAMWKEATVHPDHYIQVNKKAYSIPHPFVGKKVMVKVTSKIVEIYHNEQLIKVHTIAPPHRFRQTDPADFPENMQYALDKGLPRTLIENAGFVGNNFKELIIKVLRPHAYINLRRAQGLLAMTNKYDPVLIEEAAGIALFYDGSITPKHFKHITERLIEEKEEVTLELPLSDQTQSFIRPNTYYNQTLSTQIKE